METIVAFLRNGACVVKDVLEPTHWLMSPAVGTISVIETVIAPLQFAAVVYNFTKAVPYLTMGAASWWADKSVSESAWADALTAGQLGSGGVAVQVAQAKLAAQMAAGRTTTKVMVCKLAIGTAFILLTLASVGHAYMAAINWVLLLLELALVYLLTVMAAGVAKGRQTASDLSRLSAALYEDGRGSAVQLVAPAAIELIGPACGSPLPAPPFSAPLAVSDPFGIGAAAEYVKALAKVEGAVRTAVRRATSERERLAAELAVKAREQYEASALDAAVLLLNFIAFCGYGMFPVTYFGPKEESLSALLPAWPGHSTAQYYGNLAGDGAWTVEAALVLIVPRLLAATRPAPKAKAE